MRTTVETHDNLARDVLALATDYSYGEVLAPHRHRRAQFLYGVGGTMGVRTEHGSWLVPTERAVLIPPQTQHAVTMWGVSTRSLYIEPGAVPWFPTRCTVVDVPTLLRELLVAAVAVPLDRPPDARDAALFALTLHEVAGCTSLPLDLPLPQPGALSEQCRRFLAAPRIDTTTGWWANALHVSERTVARLFRKELSMTVAEWQRRACVLHSLRQLTQGVAVSAVASDLGYSSPAAFSTMFSRALGTSPSAFSPRRLNL
ncbi:AraC family transcriptional regulator [Mycolicibacterium goodii]|uniref:AraC family transcriptional regulator n=1 Tax=Mycolicibacterium goodii TaxID=134601 RepID=UPI000C26160B|nr:helix-turn-helix transcriptional regulator [Mycolicibacterium goodii]PJK19064.1 AraC family transcriptional regulator [Mycolicibacterium goodii]